MTRDQIAASIADELEDAGSVHFTHTDICEAIDDIYKLLAITTGFYERAAQISITAETHWLDLAAQLPYYYRPFAVYNTLSNLWLTPCAFRSLQAESDRWEFRVGNPQFFCPMGTRHIILHPMPSATAANALYVYYKGMPPDLNPTDVPDFWPELHDILVDGAVSDLLDIDLEYSKSMQYFATFQEKFARLEKAIKGRALPDRIYGLSWNYFQNPTLIA